MQAVYNKVSLQNLIELNLINKLNIEYEEVYEGIYYGTLKSELFKIWENKKIAVFDIDVEGGLNIKSQFTKNTLSIFIKPFSSILRTTNPI